MSVFTADYIVRNYPSFFEYTQMDVQDTALVAIINKAWTAKHALRKFFPFDKEGRLVIAKYSDYVESALKAFEKTIYVLGKQLKDKFPTSIASKNVTRMIINNKVEGGRHAGSKVSKLLSSTTFSDSFAIEVMNKDLCTELHRLPLEGKTNLKLILQNFYSELAQLQKTTSSLVLSVNPIDILNASTGKVASCNKLGNMAEAAPMSAATSSMMGIAQMVSETGMLLGRCYIGFSPTFLGYIFQPCYGMMGASHVDDLVSWLRAYVDMRIRPESKSDIWKSQTDGLKAPVEHMAEAATSYFYTDYSQRCVYRGSAQLAQIGLYLGSAYCVQCGVPCKELFCKTCAADRFAMCINCGTKVLRSFVEGMPNPLCPYCSKLQVECTFCGVSFRKKHALDVNVCDSCRYPTTNCFVCGKTMPKWDYIGGGDYCVTLVQNSVYAHRHCLENEMHICRVCGKRTVSPHYYTDNMCLRCTCTTFFESCLVSVIRSIKTFYTHASNKAISLPRKLTFSSAINQDAFKDMFTTDDKAA